MILEIAKTALLIFSILVVLGVVGLAGLFVVESIQEERAQGPWTGNDKENDEGSG